MFAQVQSSFPKPLMSFCIGKENTLNINIISQLHGEMTKVVQSGLRTSYTLIARDWFIVQLAPPPSFYFTTV